MKIYNTKELAEKLGIHTRTVLKLLNSGELKGKKVARKWMVTENQLKDFFEDDDKNNENE